MVAVSPCCLRSFVFDVGLTTGGVEIGLSCSSCLYYTTAVSMLQDGILYKYAVSILLILYIDGSRNIWYNTDTLEKVTFYRGRRHKFVLWRFYKMAISDAQKRAVAKYNAANYDRVELRLDKGQKDVVKAHAEARGESLNAFVNRAISETMERDTATTK